MKSVLSALDLMCVSRELACLRGSFLKKVYHVGDELLFHFYGAGEKQVLRVLVGKLIHLTGFVKENPEVPSNFCMYLRKYFKGAKLVGVSQRGLERVIVLRFVRGEEVTQILFELFRGGNVIILSDDGVIKHVLKVQRFSDRVIKSGERYLMPASDFDLTNPDPQSFISALKLSEAPELVRALARLGLGGTYAEEVCLTAGVDKNLPPSELSMSQFNDLFQAILALIKRFKYEVIQARVIFKGESVVDVVPFELKVFESARVKVFDSYNEALDFFYMRSERLRVESLQDKKVDSVRAKLDRDLQNRLEQLESFKRKAIEYRVKAELLQANLYPVERVLQSLLDARDNGFEWVEIERMIQQEREGGSDQASLIKELNYHDNEVVFDLGEGLSLPLNGDPREVMSEWFDKAKRFDAKLEGAEQSVQYARDQIASFEPEEVRVVVNAPRKKNVSGSEWFEQFKWFYTSDGLLAISGKSAEQNELLIKNYLDPDDLVFHADIFGSPFTLLKHGRDASQQSIQEAAVFTMVHSSAWSKSVAVDVLYFKPFQLSKETSTGERLTTGSFNIKGPKSVVKSLTPELCLGVELLGELSYRLISGPRSAVKARAKFFACLHHGSLSKTDAANELIEYFKSKGFIFDYNLVNSLLPNGEFRISRGI